MPPCDSNHEGLNQAPGGSLMNSWTCWSASSSLLLLASLTHLITSDTISFFTPAPPSPLMLIHTFNCFSHVMCHMARCHVGWSCCRRGGTGDEKPYLNNKGLWQQCLPPAASTSADGYICSAACGRTPTSLWRRLVSISSLLGKIIKPKKLTDSRKRLREII